MHLPLVIPILFHDSLYPSSHLIWQIIKKTNEVPVHPQYYLCFIAFLEFCFYLCSRYMHFKAVLLSHTCTDRLALPQPLVSCTSRSNSFCASSNYYNNWKSRPQGSLSFPEPRNAAVLWWRLSRHHESQLSISGRCIQQWLFSLLCKSQVHVVRVCMQPYESLFL